MLLLKTLQNLLTPRSKIAALSAFALVVTTQIGAVEPEADDLLLLIPSVIAKLENARPTEAQFSINDGVKKFTSSDSEVDLVARNVAFIKIGSQTIYIGTQQKSSINQDPILRSFDNVHPGNEWLNTSLEVTGADGRGVSLFWTGQQLYATFTVDGTQGQPSDDFRRVSQGAQQSWLRSYGFGGGPTISVVALIDPQTGLLLKAVYLSAVLSSGKSNTLLVNNMRVNALNNLEVTADSFFAPRSVRGTALPRLNNGPSPFNYVLELAPDLSTAIRAASDNY